MTAPAQGRRRTPPGPFSRLPTLARVAVVVLIVALVGELYVRAVARQLPLPTVRDEVELDLKYQQLQAADANATDPQVVFVGNSMVDAGIRPQLTEAAGGGTGYNAALLGIPIRSQARWLQEFVLPQVDPGVVVFGVTPFDLVDVPIFDTPRAAVERTYTESFDDLHPDAAHRISARASELSHLVRYRTAFRSPTLLVKASYRQVTGADPVNEREVFNQGTLADGQVLPRDRAFWERTIEADGAIGNYRSLDSSQSEPHQYTASETREVHAGRLPMDAVDEMARIITDAGARPVLLVPPVEETLMAEGDVDMAAYRRATATLVRQTRDRGITVIDLSGGGYTPDQFADMAHLNEAGSKAFSADVGAALAALR